MCCRTSGDREHAQSERTSVGMHYLELYAPSEVMSSREERAGKVDRLEWAPYSREYGFYSPLMSGSIDGTDTRPHDRGVVRAMGVECKY